MRNDKALHSAIESGSTPNYMSSKSDIVEYYRDTYGKNWRSQYTADTIKAEGLANTAKVRNTISRRVQGDRADKAAKQSSTRASFEKLGTALPPVSRTPKQDTITVTVKGTQSNGHGGIRERSFSVTFSGTQAYDFVNNPSFDDIYDEYFDGDYEGEFDSSSSELEVTSVSIS